MDKRMKAGTYQEPSGAASMTNAAAHGKGFADVGGKYQQPLPRAPTEPADPITRISGQEMGKKRA